MQTLDPGTLNRRVTIEQQTATQDDFGQPLTTWIVVRSCWAGLRVASSKDVYAAAGFVSELSHIVTMRYNSQPPITSAMRVTYAGRHFLIRSVSDLTEGRLFQQLLCIERDA